MASKDVEMKFVMVGAVAVGKTSIACRFMKDTFRDSVNSTYGASFMSKTESLMGCSLKFSVWDTAGQEAFQSIVPVYFRQADAVLLAVDVTRSQTVEDAKQWLVQVQQHAPPSVLIALVLNKVDATDLRQVSIDNVKAFATSNGMKVFECSAKTGEGVREIFMDLASTYVATIDVSTRPPSQSVRLGAGGTAAAKKPTDGKGCPC